MTTVAIIGADGAGKSTVCKAVAKRLAVPTKYLYMGVNLEASKLMLPTTRLVLGLKRLRGARPDSSLRDPRTLPPSGRSLRKRIRAALRMAYWISEEWFRQLAIWYYELLGNVVLFDRHFYADYYAYDIAPDKKHLPIPNRIHGYMLEWLYPKPDLFIMLDAPPEVLFARKGEGTLEFLEERRSQYLALQDRVDRFEIVDATQAQDDVIAIVTGLISGFVARPAGR